MQALPSCLRSLLTHALRVEMKAVNEGRTTAWGRLLKMMLRNSVTGGKVRVVRSKSVRTLRATHTSSHPCPCSHIPMFTYTQVRMMLSGAAPLPLHVHEFLVASMGCPVVQVTLTQTPTPHPGPNSDPDPDPDLNSMGSCRATA
jgi:hypothetical protein